MKILFEEYAYETRLLESILPKGYYNQFTLSLSKIYYVGYYNNSPLSTNGEAVIILPKIFLFENEMLFGTYKPEQLLADDLSTWKLLKERKESPIIYNFSVWIFRAIQNYVKRSPQNLIAENNNFNQIINNTGDADQTELGLVLSLFRYYKDNKSLFTSISKLQNAGKSNINWNKTTTQITPILQGKNIIYTSFISKRKTIDFDEELLIIFYSVLNYYKDVYGFQITLDNTYQLYKGHQFDALLENGVRKLKNIKYRYFNDRFVRLWDLLYTFFEKAESSRANKQFEEILLVKDFNIVFEDMIDDLIGDDKLPKNLKIHKDGKELDHIYKDLSLIRNDDIYFIGDSKYYKPSNTPMGSSVAKQFTYAKNVIQYNIDVFNKGRQIQGIQYRDELTEGYNITPNFFIRAILDLAFDFSKPGLIAQENSFNFSTHFEDRLFDRDSLYVQHYDINFLFVLSSYISGNLSSKQKFKNSARSKFRENLLSHFNEKFIFFKLTPSMDIQIFVEKYFKKLIGKMYRPFEFGNDVIVALEKNGTNEISSIINDVDIVFKQSFVLT